MSSAAKAWKPWFSTPAIPIKKWKWYLQGAVISEGSHKMPCPSEKPRVGVLPPQTILLLASSKHLQHRQQGGSGALLQRHLRENTSSAFWGKDVAFQ